ncbi:hypothetical protein NRB56_68700 [Nocardia sp. RB56]|uniref:Uncharacterized protein n=1 Tax=Nocardia aurantia TaxID=2585199 RepID=A0A7K0E034_9NOCA|nr:hypothetical protein [Nocardia aurantia]
MKSWFTKGAKEREAAKAAAEAEPATLPPSDRTGTNGPASPDMGSF